MIADRVPVERIGDEETLVVVHRERPEGIGGRRLHLVEMQHVLVRAIERSAIRIEARRREDGILGCVGAEVQQ